LDISELEKLSREYLLTLEEYDKEERWEGSRERADDVISNFIEWVKQQNKLNRGPSVFRMLHGNHE
jgi:hypothetical protein